MQKNASVKRKWQLALEMSKSIIYFWWWAYKKCLFRAICPCKNEHTKNVGGCWHLSCMSAWISSKVKNHAREKKKSRIRLVTKIQDFSIHVHAKNNNKKVNLTHLCDKILITLIIRNHFAGDSNQTMSYLNCVNEAKNMHLGIINYWALKDQAFSSKRKSSGSQPEFPEEALNLTSM